MQVHVDNGTSGASDKQLHNAVEWPDAMYRASWGTCLPASCLLAGRLSGPARLSHGTSAIA